MALASNTKNNLRVAIGDSAAAAEVINNLEAVEGLAAAELAFIDGVTAGTAAVGKAVVLTTGKTIDEINATLLKIGTVTVGATAAELNAAADVSVRRILIPDGNYAVLVANSGKPHIIADVTADRTITLPTPADGLEYEFVPKLNAADGHDWIFDSGSNTNYFTGGVVFLDTDAQDAADEVVLAVGNGSSNSKLQVNLPQPGTRVRFICDGTLWNIDGMVVSTTAPAFADQ